MVLVLFGGLRSAHAYYDPSSQRWLNRDAIEEKGGINLYGYVGNSPLNWIDPFGWSLQDAEHIGGVGQQSIDEMTERGERSDGWTGSGWFGGGWINNGLTLFTPRKGCKDQSLQTQRDLIRDARQYKYDDYWRFDRMFQRVPYPHVWVEATSSNPNDPKVKIDPWRNSITRQSPVVYPPPYSGGPVNAPVRINR